MTEFRTNDLPFWIALHRVYRLGSARFGLLQEAFPSMEAAWNASAAELRAAGLDPATIEAIGKTRSATTPEAEIEQLAEAGVHRAILPVPPAGEEQVIAVLDRYASFIEEYDG